MTIYIHTACERLGLRSSSQLAVSDALFHGFDGKCLHHRLRRLRLLACLHACLLACVCLRGLRCLFLFVLCCVCLCVVFVCVVFVCVFVFCVCLCGLACPFPLALPHPFSIFPLSLSLAPLCGLVPLVGLVFLFLFPSLPLLSLPFPSCPRPAPGSQPRPRADRSPKTNQRVYTHSG